MITEKDIMVGAKFRINPGPSSHSKIPYLVKVIDVDKNGFVTKVIGTAPPTGVPPHNRRFDFNSMEWEGYHKRRFERI